MLALVGGLTTDRLSPYALHEGAVLVGRTIGPARVYDFCCVIKGEGVPRLQLAIMPNVLAEIGITTIRQDASDGSSPQYRSGFIADPRGNWMGRPVDRRSC
jgi:hypothetical protein